MGKHSTTGQARLADNQFVLRLKALSEEAAQLASSLARPVPEAALEGASQQRRAGNALRPPEEVLRTLIEMRRGRFRHFPGELFADPAWDMLLDLMSAHLSVKKVTVSSLCLAAHVPNTTALRWLNALAEAGLIRRAPDPADRRRILVELTEDGEQRMDSYLRSARRLMS